MKTFTVTNTKTKEVIETGLDETSAKMIAKEYKDIDESEGEFDSVYEIDEEDNETYDQSERSQPYNNLSNFI